MIEKDIYKKTFDDIHASERTQMEVLKMASENKHRTDRITGKRIAIIATAAALVLTLGIVAYAAIDWSGFALTGDMRKSSVEQMLEEASIGYATEMVESDGTVHYSDNEGNETLVLTAEEAARYEQELEAIREDAVRSSTALVDVDTLPIVPQSVTELEIDNDGAIPDFALGNGHMVLFCDKGKTGYSLDAGDYVTLTLASNDDCRVEYFVIHDGVMLSDEIDSERCPSHTFSFEVTESGAYCFALMYASADASNFTSGTLTIDQAK